MRNKIMICGLILLLSISTLGAVSAEAIDYYPQKVNTKISVPDGYGWEVIGGNEYIWNLSQGSLKIHTSVWFDTPDKFQIHREDTPYDYGIFELNGTLVTTGETPNNDYGYIDMTFPSKDLNPGEYYLKIHHSETINLYWSNRHNKLYRIHVPSSERRVYLHVKP